MKNLWVNINIIIFLFKYVLFINANIIMFMDVIKYLKVDYIKRRVKKV